jgi:hypothetical protein
VPISKLRSSAVKVTILTETSRRDIYSEGPVKYVIRQNEVHQQRRILPRSFT